MPPKPKNQINESKLSYIKAAFTRNKTASTSRVDLNLKKQVVKRYISSTALYDAETWTLRKVYQKYLGCFERDAGQGRRK
jgi:hypothetical protein